MNNNKSKLKMLISNLFAFFLTLLFFLLIVCLGFGLGVFSQKSIISRLSESNYYKEVYQELDKNTKDIVQKAGFGVTVLKDVITLDNVSIEGNNYVNKLMAGVEPQIRTGKLEEKIRANMAQYLITMKIERTDRINTRIDRMILKINMEYENRIPLPLVRYITQYRAHFNDLMKVTFPILALLIVILSWFLLRIYRYGHRGVHYITCAFTAASGMVIVSAVYLLVTGCYRKPEISPVYYRNLVNIILEYDIRVFLYLGGTGLILSVLLASLTGYLKNRISS